MSGYTEAPNPFRSAAASARDGSGATLWDRARTAWTRLARMHRAAETRRELGTLNPRLLSDIGVTRAEAEREAERWPWDLDPPRGAGARR